MRGYGPLSWDSPYRDLAQPATRYYLGTLWQRQELFAARMFAEAAYGAVAGAMRRFTTN